MERYLEEIEADRNRIRDPLYGFIPLTKAELAIVDTPLFQRLRRIHQLALTKYVYPSAEHSRFVHSLGVMHCATLILAGIHGHKQTNILQKPHPKLIKILRFAALLHDIGHLPFSHAVEKQWLQGLSHEDLGQFIIEKYEPIVNAIQSEDISCKQVATLLTKNPPAQFRLLHEIVSGQLDADRADYLLRDSHCCGVRYGEYDFERFLHIFAAQGDESTGVLSLCVDEGDLHVAESLLIARYHYNLQIPYHRTRSGYDIILRKFVKDYMKVEDIFTVKDGRLENVDFDRLEYLDDGTIMETIKKCHAEGNPWTPYLLRQKHLLPLVDTSSLSRDGILAFKEAVHTLRNQKDLEENEDYFIQEQPVELLKNGQGGEEPKAEKDIGPEMASAGLIRLLVRMPSGDRKPVDIREHSWIFGQLHESPHLVCRIYVPPEKKDCLLPLLDKPCATEMSHAG